jgi:hypothetical protein
MNATTTLENLEIKMFLNHIPRSGDKGAETIKSIKKIDDTMINDISGTIPS